MSWERATATPARTVNGTAPFSESTKKWSPASPRTGSRTPRRRSLGRPVRRQRKLARNAPPQLPRAIRRAAATRAQKLSRASTRPFLHLRRDADRWCRRVRKNATLRHAMRGNLDAVARMMGEQHAEQARGVVDVGRRRRWAMSRPEEGHRARLHVLQARRAARPLPSPRGSLSVRRLPSVEPRAAHGHGGAALLLPAAGSAASPEAPSKPHVQGPKASWRCWRTSDGSFDCKIDVQPDAAGGVRAKVVAPWTDACSCWSTRAAGAGSGAGSKVE